MRYTIDTEFDGHGGPLISIALVPEEGDPFYFVAVTYSHTFRGIDKIKDVWVRENVYPYLESVPVEVIVAGDARVGEFVRDYFRKDKHPHIIADSPVDIWRFCQVVSTDLAGGWTSTDFAQLTFEVHNVDCWPNNLGPEARQHNAYWDAVALWEKINAIV